MGKSLTIYGYIKKIIVGKPFLKPLPHRNPLPHFTYSIFDPPCFPAKPISLKKKKQQPSVDRPPQCFSFGILTLHTTCASLRSKNIFHAARSEQGFTPHLLAWNHPLPHHPHPTHTSCPDTSQRAVLALAGHMTECVTSPLLGLWQRLWWTRLSVWLGYHIFFYTYIYIKIEKYAHAL